MSLLASPAAVSLAQGGRGYGPGSNEGAGQGSAGLPAASALPLDAEAIAAMEAGYLDEYNAYMAYDYILSLFGEVRPFSRIQAAELQHMAAWEQMFERYDLALPELTEDFTWPEFESLSEACNFAYTAEVNNMQLYEDMAATFADYPDLAWVANRLKLASQNQHLPAFERCAR